jgi:hypothetical protein
MKVLGIRFCAVAEEAVPMEAHGEKIYFAVAPGGLSVSFQEIL